MLFASATSAGVRNKHEKGLSNLDTSKIHQIHHKKGLTIT